MHYQNVIFGVNAVNLYRIELLTSQVLEGLGSFKVFQNGVV